MPKTTPFHSRLEPLNETRIWKNWAGYLVAPNYQFSIATEYYSIRNAVSVLDTSPLFKYEISGDGARDFLKRVFARDVSTCKSGKAQYTVWCDENGFVVQDGVVICISENCFRLTAAEPTLRYFRNIVRKERFPDVEIEDVSERFGILAVQGPHAHDLLSNLTNEISELKYFEARETEIDSMEVLVSRTGYTGDLGYEIWCKTSDGCRIWDLLMKHGDGLNVTPIGTTAMKMARTEAGLLLMGVDFHSAKLAWVDEQRETPAELGWGWMFRRLSDDSRDFIGRPAIETEANNKSSRWKTVGLEIDWHEYQRVHRDAGISTPMDEVYAEQTMSLYRISDRPYDYAGYASSFLFSSMLKKPIAIAKLPLDMTQAGTELEIEMTVIRKPVYVKAKVTKLPFLDPPRKTARMF